MRLNISLDKQAGHALSEYGLAIGLVVIVSISALSMLGNQVSRMFDNTIVHRDASGFSLSNNQRNRLNPPLTNMEIQKILNEAPTKSFQTSEGRFFTIPDPNYDQLLDTIGPTGIIQVKQALEVLIARLLNTGNPDPLNDSQGGQSGVSAHVPNDPIDLSKPPARQIQDNVHITIDK